MFMPRPLRVGIAALVSLVPAGLFIAGLIGGGVERGGMSSIVSALILGLVATPIVAICFDQKNKPGLSPFIDSRIGNGLTTAFVVMAMFWMPIAVIAALPLIVFVSLIADRMFAASRLEGV